MADGAGILQFEATAAFDVATANIYFSHHAAGSTFLVSAGKSHDFNAVHLHAAVHSKRRRKIPNRN